MKKQPIISIKPSSISKFTKWIDFLNENRLTNKPENAGQNDIHFHFDQNIFLEPYHITSLACLIQEYALANFNISFSFHPENLLLREYLTQIQFIQRWDDSIYNDTNFNYYNTNLALWHLSSERLHEYAQKVTSYITQLTRHEKDCSALSIILAELFNNIIDHSGSVSIGFSLIEFYPSSKKIKLALCDLGIGIPKKIQIYQENAELPIDSQDTCLVQAFKLKFTTQSTPQNRGRGLDTIKSIMLQNELLRVVSNKAIFSINHASENCLINRFNFPGTCIEIILDTKKLPNYSDLIEDIEFG